MSDTRQEILELIRRGGKYALREEFHDGMNAYAFLARHLPLDKDVFVKVYPGDPTDADIFKEPRFLVQATEANDSDANLVQVYDAECLSSEYVLVAMEFVDGGSILQRLQNGPLPLMDAVTITIGMLHGAARLHRQSLVHRDIKPANVLLTDRNGRPWPKLSDFGSVARLSSADSAVTASKHSPLYVPPEGWGQPSQYGTRSDLYQVGVVLSEMAHGALPYHLEAWIDGEARAEIRIRGATRLSQLDPFDRSQIVDRALARLAASGRILALGPSQPYVPRSLARIINRSTAPAVAERYQTASEMIGDLERLLLPNWTPIDGRDVFEATYWRGWACWRVEPNPRGSGGDTFTILRCREPMGRLRRWKTAATARDACRLVGEVS